MADQKMMMMIVLLIAGLVVGTGIGYYVAPPKVTTITTTTTQTIEVAKPPLDGKTVTIGVVVGFVEDLNINTPNINEICLPDINAYVKTLGLNTNFVAKIDNAQENAATHLEKVQAFKSMGIDLVIGAGWSSMIQASKNYVDTNNMLLQHRLHITYSCCSR